MASIPFLLQRLVQLEEISHEDFSRSSDAIFNRVVCDRDPIVVAVDEKDSFTLIESQTIHWLYRMEFVAADIGTTERQLEQLVKNHPICVFDKYSGSAVFEYECRMPWEALHTDDPIGYVRAKPRSHHGTCLKGLNDTPFEDLTEPLAYAVCSLAWKRMVSYLIERVRIFHEKAEAYTAGEMQLGVSEVLPRRGELLAALSKGMRVYVTKHNRNYAVIEPPGLFQPAHAVISITLSQLVGGRDALDSLLEEDRACLALSTRDSEAAGYIRKA